MNWHAFTLHDQHYDLSHLDGFAYDLTIPAKDDKPEQVYRLNVTFSIHCFTRSARADEVIERNVAYRDSRETRIFDVDRYQQSKRLREMLETLADKKCYHDKHGNYYVFEVEDKAGVKGYYSVFFTVSKAGRKEGLNLYVTTAHVRPEPPGGKNVKPVRFSVIVRNIWTSKGLKPAP
jgi:hypothetical protein